MKKYSLLAVMIAFFSCSKDNDASDSALAGKTFDHLLFETQQQCLAAQTNPDFFINCHEEIEFTGDDSAVIMLQDILYNVDYTLDGNKIIVSFPGDPSATLTFEKTNNASLKLLGDGTVWNKRIGNSIWH